MARLRINNNLSDEEWRDIPGYEGLYQVSNLGRVKSLPRGRQYPSRQTHNNIRVLKLKSNGYYQVNLSKFNKVKCYSVHRLVALAFIPNPKKLPCINHKDENKTNNCVENLEWCTRRYNCVYGTGRIKQKAARQKNDPDGISWLKALDTRDKRNRINSRKKVLMFDINNNFIKDFDSISQASRETNISASDICNCCKGRRNQTKGFIWNYEN